MFYIHNGDIKSFDPADLFIEVNDSSQLIFLSLKKGCFPCDADSAEIIQRIDRYIILRSSEQLQSMLALFVTSHHLALAAMARTKITANSYRQALADFAATAEHSEKPTT